MTGGAPPEIIIPLTDIPLAWINLVVLSPTLVLIFNPLAAKPERSSANACVPLADSILSSASTAVPLAALRMMSAAWFVPLVELRIMSAAWFVPLAELRIMSAAWFTERTPYFK